MGALTTHSFYRFLIQLIISESVFLFFRPKRSDFPIRLAVTLLGVFLAGYGWYRMLAFLFTEQNIAVTVFYWIGLFGITLVGIGLVFDLQPIEILFAGTGGYATEHMTFAVVKVILYSLNIGISVMNRPVGYLFFRFFIYILGAAAIYYLIIRPNKEKESFKPGDYRIVELAIVILLGAIILSVLYTESDLVEAGQFVSEIVCPMYGILCCGLVLVLEYYVLRENRMEEERKVMEELLQMAASQQKVSKETIDIINIKCHDLKHQMASLADMEENLERKQYVEELRNAVNIYDATYHTGCEALDYVLREKTLLANEYEVMFSCLADGTVLSFMSAPDVYALMGNALDNALEAIINEPVEKRIINMILQKHEEMVLFHLENTCSISPEFVNGLPQTTKEDKNAHGFGVRSIRYISEKYGGDLYMRYKEDVFSLDILFPEVRPGTVES